MTCPCSAQAYVSDISGGRDIYLSPMHINERCIIGYEIPDTHPELIDLTAQQRDKYQLDKLNKSKLAIGTYIYEVMKKIKGNGCILAAYHYG